MSVQSDIEFLTIQAIEKYSQKNKTSFNETTALFQNHQVFEKIITQHEYLHQVDTEYLLEFVENVIGPVADDNTLETVQFYLANALTTEEAINRLKYSKVNNQVSFHSKKALTFLTKNERFLYEL